MAMVGWKGETRSSGRSLMKGEYRSKRLWQMKDKRKGKYKKEMSRVDRWGKKKNMIEIVIGDGK